ncbi:MULTISPECIES: low molecular weight phosphatase family protein [unclassified Nocardia]|uniref:arsenate-mycothiol transferase ArsC n=1 Tax=unclassified Nocardia TaxID=2637762 RepID=UPI0024A80BCE|nr:MULTISPECIES: low molecular weight phosphatase family protein [unclassified Nocardia]
MCVKNGGKSQMAAGLMRHASGGSVDVYSAGTEPGVALNALSVEALLELGVDITGETPKAIDPQLLYDVDLVVTLGREARLDPVPGTRSENWDTDEPSERGIDGIERMRLIRDDIATRVRELSESLNSPSEARVAGYLPVPQGNSDAEAYRATSISVSGSKFIGL